MNHTTRREALEPVPVFGDGWPGRGQWGEQPANAGPSCNGGCPKKPPRSRGGVVTNNANGVLQELGDASMLSNGNIVRSRKVGASEITPEKKSFACLIVRAAATSQR